MSGEGVEVEGAGGVVCDGELQRRAGWLAGRLEGEELRSTAAAAVIQ